MKRKADDDEKSFTPSSKVSKVSPSSPSSSPSSSSQLPKCVLFCNEPKTVFVIDIPRSLEEAQVPTGDDPDDNNHDHNNDNTPRRRIYSTPPVSEPFSLPEPKNAAAMQMALAPSALLQDLMTGGIVKAALDELASAYTSPMCLPRVTIRPAPKESKTESQPTHGPSPSPPLHIPPRSHPLHGSISSLLPSATRSVPPSSLNLIVLDPPWPNASARRNRRSSPYATCATMPDTARLLRSIPVASWLAPGGLVAVWVTNKHAILPMLTAAGRSSPGGNDDGDDDACGVFAAWGVELVAEWVWVKVTDKGEPIFDVDGFYRKPWERLLIARRRSPSMTTTRRNEDEVGGQEVRPRVIVAVPDVHSRKPNLRPLFDDLLPRGYQAMEIFARNLTAGWWSWGDDVLKFQSAEWWTDGDE